MPYKLLWEEVMKRDYFLMKAEKDQKWKGGELQVPFKGGSASSIKYGGLTDVADIVENKYVLGTVGSYKEIWGSMMFNDHDLQRHGDLEQSFIKVLPDQLEEFITAFKETVSINLLNGSHIATLDVTAAATDLANGIVVVDRPARLGLGQYLEFGVIGTSRTSGYVEAINMSDKAITINVLKDLSGAQVDLSAAGVVAGDKAYIAGAIVAGNGFTSMRDQLLSAANFGSASLFGVTKADYPHLQAFNYDGSGMGADTVLESIFDAYNETRTIGKGAPTDVIMSYKHLSSCMKALESGGGSKYGLGRQATLKDSKASVYGWTELEVIGVKGKLKLIGVQEMDDDIIHIIDWKSLKLHSNGFFERRSSPEGRQYYEIRNGDGYQYIVDNRFFGELVVSKPSHNGIIHSIDY